MKAYELLTKTDLQNVLSSFWRERFNDDKFLDGWTEGLAIHNRQLDKNLKS